MHFPFFFAQCARHGCCPVVLLTVSDQPSIFPLLAYRGWAIREQDQAIQCNARLQIQSRCSHQSIQQWKTIEPRGDWFITRGHNADKTERTLAGDWTHSGIEVLKKELGKFTRSHESLKIPSRLVSFVCISPALVSIRSLLVRDPVLFQTRSVVGERNKRGYSTISQGPIKIEIWKSFRITTL